MLIIYNLLLFIAIVLFLPLVIFKIISDKNLKINLLDRLTLYPSNFKKKLNNKKIIWIHCSSVGEVNVANILTRELRKSYSNYHYLITTMTYTGHINAINSKLYDFVIVVPFDIYFLVQRFLRIINPQILLVTETEFWPNIFYLCKKKKIPVIVYNCRVSDKSFQNYYKFRFFFSKILNCATKFLCQNQITAKRLRMLEVEENKIKISGNLKFDINFDSFSKDEVFKEFGIKKKENLFIITAGSTHEPEEEKIIKAVKKINNFFLILAPRHPNRVSQIIKILKEKELSYNLLSTPNKDKNARVLIIDKIGYLVKAYSISDVCFIGGSLSLTGGHNPLEAVFFKKPVISGRNVFNFSEIYSELEKNNGVIFVNNEQELANILLKLQKDKKFATQIAENAYKVLEKNRGAISFTINEISKIIN